MNVSTETTAKYVLRLPSPVIDCAIALDPNHIVWVQGPNQHIVWDGVSMQRIVAVTDRNNDYLLEVNALIGARVKGGRRDRFTAKLVEIRHVVWYIAQSFIPAELRKIYEILYILGDWKDVWLLKIDGLSRG